MVKGGQGRELLCQAEGMSRTVYWTLARRPIALQGNRPFTFYLYPICVSYCNCLPCCMYWDPSSPGVYRNCSSSVNKSLMKLLHHVDY